MSQTDQSSSSPAREGVVHRKKKEVFQKKNLSRSGTREKKNRHARSMHVEAPYVCYRACSSSCRVRARADSLLAAQLLGSRHGVLRGNHLNFSPVFSSVPLDCLSKAMRGELQNECLVAKIGLNTGDLKLSNVLHNYCQTLA